VTLEGMTNTTDTLPPYRAYPEGPLPDAPPPSARRQGHSGRRGAALLAATALAAGLVGGGVGAAVTAAVDDDARAPFSALDVRTASNATGQDAPAGSVEQVAASVLPSVVSLAVRTSTGGGEGTGVVLDTDGLILTNNHVVEPAADGGSVTVTSNDGSSAPARIIGRDPVTDLAVVRADGLAGLVPARLGDSESLAVGEDVVAIGSPLGLSGTVTSGIVSALDRPVRAGGSRSPGQDSTSVIDAIQTDAAVNPGNSGGPLVDRGGAVVGINSAIASLGAGAGGQAGSIGLGFAIPIDQAREIARQLVDSGTAEHAQLGVSVGDAGVGSSGVSSGAAIASVQPDAAAADAGLRDGDVLRKVDDHRVDSADALIAAVRSHRAGDQVTVTYVRDGDTRTTTVTLGSDRG
jgi:putative serine protease PepD